MLASTSSSQRFAVSTTTMTLFLLFFLLIHPTGVYSFGIGGSGDTSSAGTSSSSSSSNSWMNGIFNKQIKINKNQSVTKILFDKLNKLIDQAPKNGIDTPPELEAEIMRIAQVLGKASPIPQSKMTSNSKINGFWKMKWTNFAPAAPSSGKLGPLIGTVYQDIDLSNGIAKNILKIDTPPLQGCLLADAKIANENTIAIAFKQVNNKLIGKVPVGPQIKFDEGKEIRLWEHIYLDDTYRILYARRVTDIGTKGFLYIMIRAENERFEPNV